MLTKNIKVDFWVVENSNFRKNFLPIDSSGSEVSKKLGDKKNSICEKKFDDPLYIYYLNQAKRLF